MKLPSSLSFVRKTRLWQSLRDRRYLRDARPRREHYRAFVPPGSLVFDIGANVGHYTLLFASLQARVIAVEPQGVLVTELRRRFAGRRQITVVQTALGAVPGTAVLHKAPDQSETASLRDDVSERSRFAGSYSFSERETVPVTTLDALIASHGMPVFCKIDVEGFEDQVLAGLSRALPLLSLEFNREYWDVATASVSRLAALGDYEFNHSLGENTTLNRTWVDADTLLKALATSPDPLLWGDLYARLKPAAVKV